MTASSQVIEAVRAGMLCGLCGGRVEEMGELSIQFGSLEALNGLIDRLRGNA